MLLDQLDLPADFFFFSFTNNSELPLDLIFTTLKTVIIIKFPVHKMVKSLKPDLAIYDVLLPNCLPATTNRQYI